jgi:hypothetical protein
MHSFKITDFRDVSPLSADCVGIASVTVMGVAQCLLTAN